MEKGKTRKIGYKCRRCGAPVFKNSYAKECKNCFAAHIYKIKSLKLTITADGYALDNTIK